MKPDFRPRLFGLATVLAMIAAPAMAADSPEAVRRIRIAATGLDRATPDIARLGFTARGEGTSADEATAAVSTSMKAITAALGAVREGRYDVTVSDLSMTQVRDKACDNGQSYQPRPRLSTGPCAIIGYIAELQATLRLSPGTKAGTMTGVITRAGGLNARVNAFELANPAEARKRAIASALSHAQAEAEAIAKASGVRLGTVLAINNDNDRGGDEITVSANRVSAPPPPPPPPPPPIEIDMMPSPITTNAMVTVFYAIAD